MPQVYPALRTHYLQTVYQAAYAPRPGGIGTHVRQFRVEAVDGFFTPFLRVCHHLCEVEGDLCDVPPGEYFRRQAACATAYADDGGKRPFPVRVSDGGGEAQRLPVHRDIDKQHAVFQGGFHALAADSGFLADFVVLDFFPDFRPAAAPVLEVRAVAAVVRPKEGVCQGSHRREFLKRGEYRVDFGGGVFHLVDERDFLCRKPCAEECRA